MSIGRQMQPSEPLLTSALLVAWAINENAF